MIIICRKDKEEIEGGKGKSKFPISIMDGLIDSPLNGYYPADNAIVAYNVVVNSYGPAIKLGIANKDLNKPTIAPKNVVIAGNTIINSIGDNDSPFELTDNRATFEINDNFFTNGNSNESGFSILKSKEFSLQNGIYKVKPKMNQKVLDDINNLLSIHNIKLSITEITEFNPNWILKKSDVGVSWLNQ
jgi:hypothetical protein